MGSAKGCPMAAPTTWVAAGGPYGWNDDGPEGRRST
jgi:hypothetical protein